MYSTSHQDEIEDFMMEIIKTDEYQSVEYLIFSIRKLYLDYLSNLRLKQFETPKYLKPLVHVVVVKFNVRKIPIADMLQYMLNNDINGWAQYYAYTFWGKYFEQKNSDNMVDENELFALILTGYILDKFRENKINIRSIKDKEKLLYNTNKYGLSLIDKVEFKQDYFEYDDKAYLYNIFTNIWPIKFGDTMPAFARIISDKVCDGNILLRLDERLALPLDQAISYSSLKFEKYRGPQFKFNESILKQPKEIIVHIDENGRDRLLMVVKRIPKNKDQQYIWHVELETLPYIDQDSGLDYCLTTFLHGIYLPEEDSFIHIDCAKNQYSIIDYMKKLTDDTEKMAPVDLYSEKDLHYKIWCIENGHYSREIWYELMLASLNKKYQKLLNEMLA